MIDNIQYYRNEVVKGFRIGLIADGNEALSKFIEAITVLLNENADRLVERDLMILNGILAAQQRGDFNYLADLLEYELPNSGIGHIIRSPA